MEAQLLAASLASRDSYELIKEYITLKSSTYSKQFQVVMNKLGEYYARDSAAVKADVSLLLTQISETIRNDKHIATFRDMLSAAQAVDLSEANVKATVLLAKQQEVGDKLSQALVMDAGQAKVDELLAELQELRSVTSIEQLASQEEAARVLSGAELDLNALLHKENDASNLIKLYPTSLNERVDGGVKRGHHIIVFARPNAGKTATCVHMSCGFLHQGFRVLYIINEDREEDIYLRHVNNLSGYDKYTLTGNVQEAQAKARGRGIDRLVIAGLAPGSIKQIAELIEQHSPDVVIVDQLRNLNVRADSRVNQLDAAARGVRDLGKYYNVLMVSVTQAGDSAEGKAVLDMGDVDFSNTGIPAACDVLLAIGKDATLEAEQRRMISLPKNKLGREEHFVVNITPSLSRLSNV